MMPCCRIIIIIVLACVCVVLAAILNTVNTLLSPQKGSSFFGVDDAGLQFHGRWLTNQNLAAKEASFAGSSLTFTIANTTSASLLVHSYKHPTLQIASLPSVSAQEARKTAASLAVHVSVNESEAQILRQRASFILLGKALERNATHRFKIVLPSSGEQTVVQVQGLILDDGGFLVHDDSRANLEAAARYNSRRNVSKNSIEIVGSSSILGTSTPSSQSTMFRPWPSLLEDQFADVVVNTIELPDNTCLDTCDTQADPYAAGTADTAQDTFFHAGQRGTHLYKHFWSVDQSPETPKSLVLFLGLADIEAFLSSEPPKKHQILEFVDNLARRYAQFIRTMRRTLYSPAVLTAKEWATQETGFSDESYLYNSAPSTLPILLVVQPLPSSIVCPQSRQIFNILHTATQKVIDELKWHIGDRYTFAIDSTGWLEDQDFVVKGDDVSALNLGLAQSGHIKMAYHLSSHVCPYLMTIDCAFERHSEYIGNMFGPDTEDIGKVLEEKKITKIKQLFGID